MKVIHEVFSFIGLGALITAIIFYALNLESFAIVSGSISVICFIVMLFLNAYKLYVLFKMNNIDSE